MKYGTPHERTAYTAGRALWTRLGPTGKWREIMHALQKGYIDAGIEALGNKSALARSAGINRDTIWRYTKPIKKEKTNG